MSKVLYIKADIKPAGVSKSVRIADAFVETYAKEHPTDEIVTLDLTQEHIQFLNGEDLALIFGPKDEASKENSKLKYAYQFAEADKIVMAVPMWNLGIPAMLKAYIDYVSVTGISFKYTEQGAVGLLSGKKAFLAIARGGLYTGTPMGSFEHDESYLRTILGFFGIQAIDAVRAEGLDLVGADIESIVNASIEEAQTIAKQF